MPASEQRPTEQKTLAGIFISYRRTDNPDATGRIYDRLVSEFGKARVFKDVDSIPLGQDFRSHLNGIVGECAAVLAIIGPKWTDTRNAGGTRRLEDPDDFVRIELEAALSRDIPVVPVLVGHAPMPGSTELPGTLASMAYRQSIEVRPDPDFHHDATRLVSALKAIIDPNAPRESPVEVVNGAVASPATSGAAPKHWRRFAWVLAAAGVLVPLVTAIVIPAARSFRAPAPPETRTEIVTPATDQPLDFALSPDGRQIVFVAKGDGASRLWLRPLSTVTAQPLPGTEGAAAPFWSPDGRSIGFFVPGAMKRLDLAGGRPQVLATSVNFGQSGSWNSAGVILVSGLGQPLMRISASGGAATQFIKFGAEQNGGLAPVFLPDGRRFLFVMNSLSAPGIYLGALDSDTPVRLTPDSSRVAYLPSGWMFWLRGGLLLAQRLDIEKATLVGEPVKLADGVMSMSVSATGLIAYRSDAVSQLQLTWVDRSGKPLGTLGDPDGAFASPRISPDGRRVAVSRVAQGNQDIWLLDGVRASRMTFDPNGDAFPVWSPDGSQIVYMSTRSGVGDLYQKLASGAGTETQIVTSDQVKYPTDWSADGRYLLYFPVAIGGKLDADIWVLPMKGGKPFPFISTPALEVWGQFSPDGRWVAYQSSESGQNEIYVRPFFAPDTAGSKSALGADEGQWQVSTSGGLHPLWSHDGKELYFIDPAGRMMAAPMNVTGSALTPGVPVPLFKTNIFGGGVDGTQGRQYDVAQDGRFLINKVLDGAAQPITLIQNWNPDAQ